MNQTSNMNSGFCHNGEIENRNDAKSCWYQRSQAEASADTLASAELDIPN
jgi:hypothetical protein